MAEEHRKKGMKKRVFYIRLTTLFCVTFASFISTVTSNIYTVTAKITVKITVFVIVGGLFVFVFLLIMYQMTFGRRH